MRPLYIVGTQRDAGKTTMSIGLANALRQRGLKVGYLKPLGQRVTSAGGVPFHDDARVVSRALGIDLAESAELTVPLVSGRVEKELEDPHPAEMLQKVAAAARKVQTACDALIVEAMGGVAQGACLATSAPEIANALGAKVMIVSGGGIGKALDEIALCATYMTARGSELTGVVVNKVWPDKYDRIKSGTEKGLAHMHLAHLGAVPYQPILASPTVRQVADQLEAEVLCNEQFLGNRVRSTIVAAMEPDHMVGYLKNSALVITPGDRIDNILAVISTHLLASAEAPPAISGLLLTGGFRPEGKIMELLAGSHLPALLCRADTYTMAGTLRELVFKITPDDRERIEAAKSLVERYVHVDRLIEMLKD